MILCNYGAKDDFSGVEKLQMKAIRRFRIEYLTGFSSPDSGRGTVQVIYVPRVKTMMMYPARPEALSIRHKVTS